MKDVLVIFGSFATILAQKINDRDKNNNSMVVVVTISASDDCYSALVSVRSTLGFKAPISCLDGPQFFFSKRAIPIFLVIFVCFLTNRTIEIELLTLEPNPCVLL